MKLRIVAAAAGLGLAALANPAQACTVTMGGVSYPSIQAAVNVAPMVATISVDGSTGVCNENVVIPNVTLRMILSGTNGATIHGAPGSPTVDARVKGLLLQGFTITGGSRGIQLQRNANAIIDSVTVENTGGDGIDIDSMAFGVVTNSTIQNNPGAGIKVMELANVRIGANVEEDGGAIAANTIANNGGDGILVTNKATAQIIGNTISANKGNGVSISSTASASTAGNRINNNQMAGVSVSGRSYVNLGILGNSARPDTTTTSNLRFGVSCLSGAVVSGYLGNSNALNGLLSQFGPDTNAFDPTCPNIPSTLMVTGAPLNIVVGGLPSGVLGNIAINGPDGSVRKITSSSALSDLPVGTYVIAASVAQTGPASNPTYYWPTLTSNTVTVSSAAPTSITVSYQALAGIWSSIGPSQIARSWSFPSGSGEMGAIAILNSDPNIIYAGGGGLGHYGPYIETGAYKTTNGGVTWTQINNGLTDPAVQALWVDQKNPNTVLAGTFSKGIFRSTDGGSNWSQIASLGSVTTLLDYNNSVYAGTGQGIAQSTDSGLTWTIVQKTTAQVRCMATSNGAVYVGLDDGTVLFRANSTAPWISSNPSGEVGHIALSIAVSPTNPLNAYVADFNSVNLGDLYVTTNGGSSWTNIPQSKIQPICAINVQVVAIASDGVVYGGCDEALIQSNDGGNTWASASYAPWDMRIILLDAGGIAGNIIVGSDQGIYKRAPGQANWQALNTNITSSLLTGIAVSGSTFFVIAQDWPPLASFDNGKTWKETVVGAWEIGSAIVNPGNPSDVYIITYNGFQASFDGARTFSTALPYSVSAAFNQEIAVDTKHPSTVYVASTSGVLVSTNWGVTFTPTSWPVTNPATIAIDPANSENIYVAPFTPNLSYTKDGGKTWKVSSVGACGVTTIAVSPSNSNVVLAGTTCGEFYLSTDGAATFALASLTPPGEEPCQLPLIRKITFDPLGSEVIATATWSGLYLSSDLGFHWTNIRGDAIPIAFQDFQWTGSEFYAATCGQGGSPTAALKNFCGACCKGTSSTAWCAQRNFAQRA